MSDLIAIATSRSHPQAGKSWASTYFQSYVNKKTRLIAERLLIKPSMRDRYTPLTDAMPIRKAAVQEAHTKTRHNILVIGGRENRSTY